MARTMNVKVTAIEGVGQGVILEATVVLENGTTKPFVLRAANAYVAFHTLCQLVEEAEMEDFAEDDREYNDDEEEDSREDL